MNIMLSLQPLKPLSKISPSRYSSLRKCALREILADNFHVPLLPNFPSIRLGIIIHKLFEHTLLGRITNEESMKNFWEKEIKSNEEDMRSKPLEKYLLPLSRNINGYKVKQVSAFNMIRPMFIRNRSRIKNKKIKTEVWVQTEDGKIGGKIDLVKETTDGIYLIDYKTGNITTDSSCGDGLIKEEYQEQLKIYAALYYKSYHIWPEKLILLGLDKKEYNVFFEKEECLSILNTAKDYLDNLNQLITSKAKNDTFATPSQNICKFCIYRPSCRMYWEKKEDTKEWPADFVGIITEKRLLGNNSLKIVLENQEKRVSIRGLSPERYEFLNQKIEKAMFCNLGYDVAPGFFKETNMTVGYGL